MKAEIHPKYSEKATATCACGATFLVGSTEDELRVEICSNCHPFFTGKQKLVDTAGRVDKFRARVAAAKKLTPEESSRAKSRDLKEKTVKEAKKQAEETKTEEN